MAMPRLGIAAEPNACNALASSRSGKDGAIPASSDAAAKMHSPMTNMRRKP
jgi:hypothetical protein